MKLNLRRTGALSAAALMMAGLAVAGASGAQAAPVIGSLTGVPANGNTSTPFSVKASQNCPSTTQLMNAYIQGPGWTDILAIGANDTDIQNVSGSGVPMSDTLTGIAQSNGVALVNGTYSISLICQDDIFASTATSQFNGSFTVTGTNYAFAAVSAPASTTTLAVTPSSPQNVGTPVTLTANVSSSAAVAGTVQFKDGAANLGSPVAVAGGSAALTTSALTGGSHQLTAQFIPADAAVVSGSTSSAVPFTIVAPAQATTVTLSSGPAAPTTADVVSLTAAVTPANAVGTVTFKEGSTTVGTSPVSGGSASVSLTGLSAGTHSYTADFVPANPANFLASSASALSIDVTAFTGVSDSENITTKIDPGALTITAGGPTVDLGTLALNSANSLLVQGTPKDINPVTVTDTRAGNPGWNVNGQVADFASGAGNKINSENLGWAPSVVSQQPTQNVTKGADVAAGNGIAVGTTTGAGLKMPRLLASAAAGGSVGTAVVSAKLNLTAPTSTAPGTYNSILTLTAI